jgi:hypothetical protein
LSSEDISLTDQLLETCANTLNQKLFASNEQQTPIERIEHLAELTAKLIMCATENVETDRLSAIDKIIDQVLNRRAKAYKTQGQLLTHLAGYVEVLNGTLTAKTLTDDAAVSKSQLDTAMEEYFTLSLFKLTVIFKLSCNVKKRERPSPPKVLAEEADDNDEICGRAPEMMDEEDEELTEDFCNSDETLLKAWSDEIYDQMLECLEAAALSDTILYNTSNVSEESCVEIRNLSLCFLIPADGHLRKPLPRPPGTPNPAPQKHLGNLGHPIEEQALCVRQQNRTDVVEESDLPAQRGPILGLGKWRRFAL